MCTAMWCHLVNATEVTTGLAKSMAAYCQGGWLKVTCGLTACIHRMASISHDYWGDIKEDWGSWGQKSPIWGPGAEPRKGVPQKLKLFCETTHNVCIKIQQRTVAVTRVDILNDIASKILGGDITMDVPFLNIGGHVPPVP